MSGRKRPGASRSSAFDVDSDLPPSKKRGLTMKTVDKWIVDNDKTLNTTTWLKYDKVDREYVATLKCSVCFRFNDKLRSARNYNSTFVVGSTNLRASAFKEHAASDMHLRAMTLLKKSQGSALVEYAPIAKMLSTLDDDAERKLKRSASSSSVLSIFAIGAYSTKAEPWLFLRSVIARRCMSEAACSLKAEARRFVEPTTKAEL